MIFMFFLPGTQHLLLLVLCLLDRFNCLTSPLLSLLNLFFELSVSTCYLPIHDYLSRSASHSFSFFLSSESSITLCTIHFLCVSFLLCVIWAISFPILSNTSSFL